MLRSLKLHNFKCYGRCQLDLFPLTLLTGVNGSGKSALLQAILLLQQVIPGGKSHLDLNDRNVLFLGQAGDALWAFAKTSDISFEVSWGDNNVTSLSLDATDGTSLTLPIVKSKGKDPFCKGFCFLDAERLGPQDFHQMASLPQGLTMIGAKGEFSVQALARRELKGVREALCFPLAENEARVPWLRTQVEKWMSLFVSGFEVFVEELPGTNLVRLGLRNNRLSKDWLRPANTGFGISYALPIVIAGLTADPGSLLIVQNPEAHLHPSAQSNMGKFLATLAAGGVQVIAETHSDHIINGIRVACISPEFSIDNAEIGIHFFTMGERQSEVTRITVNQRGELSEWPTQFFDQSERDLFAILQARRNA